MSILTSRHGCLRCLLLVMCTYPLAKTALTLYLACGEGCESYFGCNLMQRKVLASSHQHLIAEAPTLLPAHLPLYDSRRRRLGFSRLGAGCCANIGAGRLRPRYCRGQFLFPIAGRFDEPPRFHASGGRVLRLGRTHDCGLDGIDPGGRVLGQGRPPDSARALYFRAAHVYLDAVGTTGPE